MMMAVGFAQTAKAQRGITVYGKGSDKPVATASFAQVKSLRFAMPSVVMMTADDKELQTLDIKQLDRIVITDDVVTAIKDVTNAGENATDGRMYNMLGQEVKAARGAVIKNGKKFIVTTQK